MIILTPELASKIVTRMRQLDRNYEKKVQSYERIKKRKIKQDDPYELTLLLRKIE